MLITYSEMAGKKGPNFSQLEKHTLVDLIGPKKDIIESKASDANMVYKKNSAWENLMEEFNSRYGVIERITPQLKSLWKNMKAKCKSAIVKENQERMKTGGVVAEGCVDEVCTAVRQIIQHQTITCKIEIDDEAEFHGDMDNITVLVREMQMVFFITTLLTLLVNSFGPKLPKIALQCQAILGL